MADDVRVTNLSDSGSRERVAYDLYRWLSNNLPKGKEGADRILQNLQLYSACLHTVQGGTPDVSKLT